MLHIQVSYDTCISRKYTAVHPLSVAQTRPLAGDDSTGPQSSQGDEAGGRGTRGAGRGDPARRGHSELGK